MNNFCRISNSYGISRYIFSNNTSSTNYGIFTNSYALQYYSIYTNKNIIFNNNISGCTI